ncbi:MAG: response regulator [Pseudomonadota bacterium]
MEQAYSHTVLIVDDEEMVGKAIAGILKKMNVRFAYAASGEIALEKIKGASPAFSLIISDQRMPGMSGYELFEKVREISPDTIRFLITGYTDMVAIIEAVNKGAIHRYIPKPWDNAEFIQAIEAGLKQYELLLENDRLLKLAKEQNVKLYKLNRDLKEKAEDHKRMLETLDMEIDALNRRISSQESAPSLQEKQSLEILDQLLAKQGLMDKEKTELFFAAIVQELYSQFQDLSARNGFEMPEQI